MHFELWRYCIKATICSEIPLLLLFVRVTVNAFKLPNITVEQKYGTSDDM